MQLKRAFTKEQSRQKIVDEKYRKVFIVGLNPELEKADVREYFEKFGEIDDVRIICDKVANASRGKKLSLFDFRLRICAF